MILVNAPGDFLVKDDLTRINGGGGDFIRS